MKALTINIKKDAEQIAELITSGVNSWVEAGRLIAARMDDDPEYIEKLASELPEVSIESLQRLEDIGRKRIDPRLLLSFCPGTKRLATLPFELQQRYIDNPVPLLILNDGSVETLKVDVRNLTTSQASQVFANGRIRTAAEQRAYLEDKKASRATIKFDPPYRVVNGKLVIMEPCQFTAKQVALLLAEMEK